MCRYQTGTWNLYVLFTEGPGANPRVLSDPGGGGSVFPKRKQT